MPKIGFTAKAHLYEYAVHYTRLDVPYCKLSTEEKCHTMMASLAVNDTWTLEEILTYARASAGETRSATRSRVYCWYARHIQVPTTGGSNE
jgi:hypothetical protein